MTNLSAFTVLYNIRVNALVTKCGVCVAYDPRIQIDTPHPIVKFFTAIWDTGATNSAISQKVINELSLKSTGKTTINTAGGEKDTDTYSVNIILPNNVAFSTLNVTKGELIGTDVLIGMDIISRGDFAISTKDGKTLFSFQLPSTHSLDFQEEIEKIKTSEKNTKIGRNEPCPCGSGKKFKKCHGK